jgi:hypothetical protein
MSSKISRAVALDMAKAITTHAHKDEAMAMLRQERALFRKMYDMHHPAELRAKMAEVQALLGEGQYTFVDDCDYIYARSASGYSGSLRINPYLRGEQRMSWQLAIEKCPLALRSFDVEHHRVTSDLSQEFEAFVTAKAALERNISESCGKAVNAVLAFGTYKKLQAGWPEVLPLVEKFIPIAGQTSLPAVCVSDLNVTFNLPPELEGV